MANSESPVAQPAPAVFLIDPRSIVATAPEFIVSRATQPRAAVPQLLCHNLSTRPNDYSHFKKPPYNSLSTMTTPGTAPTKAQPLSVSRPDAGIEELVESVFAEDLLVAAGHAALNEDLALALLRRRDLVAPAIEALARNTSVIQRRKVLIEIVEHQRTPRHIALPFLRRLFTFELMDVALAPAVPADLKLVAEDLLIKKLETLSLGERIALARRGSPGVAGALLLHAERPVVEASMQNPRLTEASIVKSLTRREVPVILLSMLIAHPKWSLRREIQLAILRRPEATETIVRQTAAKLPKPAIYEILQHTRLPEHREALLRRLLEVEE
jgi:hypothetical protein